MSFVRIVVRVIVKLIAARVVKRPGKKRVGVKKTENSTIIAPKLREAGMPNFALDGLELLDRANF